MQARHTGRTRQQVTFPQGQTGALGPASADLRLYGTFRVLVIDIAAHSTSIHSLGSEEYPIARLVAVGLAVMLSVPAWGQRLGTALTAQAGPVPVLAQGGHLLSEVHLLVASRTHVGFSGECGDTRGFAGTLGGSAGLPLLGSHHRDLDGASDLRTLSRRLLIDVGTSTSYIHPFGSKQCGITGLVAEGLPIMLSMATGGQCLVAALTLETELVPVFAQGAHLLGCGQEEEVKAACLFLLQSRSLQAHIPPFHTTWQTSSPLPTHPWRLQD